MRRLLVTSVAISFLAMPSLALDKAQECNLQAQIANAIVEERNSGSSKRRAERRVKARLGEDGQKYEVAVPAMVDWIYGLPKDQLTPEVGEALTQACMTQ